MVGSVKPRAFEYDAHRLKDFMQGLFVALRAAGQGWVAELLLLVELNAAT
jgi:hypothetical protein